MQRFVHMLEAGLFDCGDHVRTVIPKPFLGRLKPSATGLGKWLGYVDRFVIFPVNLRRALRWADLVHICDHGNSVYTLFFRAKPCVVTCHDLFGVSSAKGEVPENPVGWTGRMLVKAMMDGLARARMVACVSARTSEDLLSMSDLKPDKVRVIENGLDHSFRPMEAGEAQARLAALEIPEGPFLLHVGGNQWYKNRLGVFRIFSEVIAESSTQSFRLISVGKPWTHEMRRVVVDLGLSGRVLELTGVSDEDLRALYSTAQALLFPSLKEGFGWPVIEAQACGCPVFTSDRVPLCVVGGNAARYLDPMDPTSAAKVVREGLQDRECMRALGFENAKRYSVERMVAGYLSTYRDAVSGRVTTSDSQSKAPRREE